MKARQVIGGAAFTPDTLKVIYEAFDAAWAEVGPDVSRRAQAIEAARQSLAAITLSIAAAGPVDRDAIKAAAVQAFRRKHQLAGP
jgi:hypothetical protein